MRTFTRNQIARKTYDCATCAGKIQPGQLYIRVTAYDWGDAPGWMTYTTHPETAQCSSSDSLIEKMSSDDSSPL